MATVASPGNGLSPGPARLVMSPIAEISGWPGSVRSGRTSMRPARSVLAPVACARVSLKLAARTPAAQITVRAGIRSVAPPTSIVTPCGSISVARAPSRTVTPSSARYLAALADSFSLNAGTTRSPASSRITRALAGSIRAKLRFGMLIGEDGERSGDLHPGGSAADDGERQPLVPRLPVARSLRLLERAVDAVAQVEGVAERLQAARDVLPFVVAEVGRAGAAGDDQAVVVETLAAVEDHLPPLGVHVGGLGHHDRRVGAAPERRPQRRGALARRDGARRELVEQGLEEVVVRPIDQRHLDVGAPQLLGGGQATEPAADV